MTRSLIPYIRSQLAPDYPSGTSFAWLDGITWIQKTVSCSTIDRATGPTEWTLAEHDRAKLAVEARKIRDGTAKPILLIKTPGDPKYFALNGHTRIISAGRMNKNVKAIIGLVKTDHGPWEKHRSSSHAAEHDDIIDLAYLYDANGPGGFAFNPSLHPHGTHGHFAYTTGGRKPAAAGKKTSAGTDPEDQALLAKAQTLRTMAKADRQQAHALFRQVQQIIHPTVNPARSAAAKKAAATRAAHGLQLKGKGHSTNPKTTGKAKGTKTTTRTTTARALMQRGTTLMNRATALDTQADQLISQAAV